MPQVLAQPALQRVLQVGIRGLKDDPDVLDRIFEYYLCDSMVDDYGQGYIDNIKSWFLGTKIPVVQAWSSNPQKVPQISIHLATEQEDESKASMGDYMGLEIGDSVDQTTGVSVFTVMLDVGIHGSRNGDEVIWMYHIISYILFKYKRLAESLGLRLHTWSATDYDKNPSKMADNVWTRWLRFRCTVQNYWGAEDLLDIGEIKLDIDADGYEESGDGDITDIVTDP